MNGTTNGILIDQVVAASSSFAYFDATGTLFTPNATTVPNIKRIDITLMVTGVSNPFTNSVWINESYK